MFTNRLDRPHVKGLRVGMEKAGYIEGENLLLDIRPRNTVDELRVAAKFFVNQKFDAIVANGNIETGIAQQETTENPIVFMPASAPVRAGFVQSMAHPGTNLTGVTYYTDIRESGKRLEIFKELLPSLQVLLILIDAESHESVDSQSMAFLRKVATHLRIKLVEKPVNSLLDVERAVLSLTKLPMDGIHVVCGGVIANFQKKLGRMALERKLPLYGCSSAHVASDGALFTYAPDMHQLGLRTAWYVDRILKGTKPQNLPVESPRKFDLVINLNTATAIGIKIPPELLQRADKVIKEASAKAGGR
jgi:putative ABC transport system substrate-binding protein